MRKYTSFLALIALSFCVTSIYQAEAVQFFDNPGVIPQPYTNPTANSFNSLVDQCLVDAIERRKEQERRQAELDAKLRIQREKEKANQRHAAAQDALQEEKNKILRDVLEGWSPSKNSEYVLKILQSDLSIEIKQCIIDIINEQTRHHEESISGTGK